MLEKSQLAAISYSAFLGAQNQEVPVSRIRQVSRRWLPGAGLTVALLALPFCAQAQNYQQLYSFKGAKNGSDPYYGPTMYKDGLYGTTFYGGAHGDGAIFKLSRNGGEKTVLSLSGKSDGSGPGGPLIADKSGNLYGIAYLGGGGPCRTIFGNGCGTVFKLAPDGTLSVLHAFQGGSDGAQPNAGVTMDANGNLFGTTSFGGGGSCDISGEPAGCGTVFEIAADGNESVLYAFKGGTMDGELPYSNLVTDKSGNLYGTTTGGGVQSDDCGSLGCGTVFKLTPDGTETMFYAFCNQANCADGAAPYLVNLIIDKKGNLYGTTTNGGAYGTEFGGGVVFELAPNGTETVLYSFCSAENCTDGSEPYSGVVADKRGNLYGTTFMGGAGCGGYGCGVAYRLAPDGTESVLYTLCSKNNCADGAEPSGGVILDKSGDVYGTTDFGGTYADGAVFEITP